MEGTGRGGPSHQHVAAQKSSGKNVTQLGRTGLRRRCTFLVQSHKGAEEDSDHGGDYTGGAGALPRQGSVPGPCCEATTSRGIS